MISHPEEYIPLVHKIVRSLGQQTSQRQEELFAVGCLALCELAQKYRGRQGEFPTFAWKRVRGAMLDTFRGRGECRLLETVADPSTSICGRIDDRDQIEVLMKKSRLSRREKEILRRCFLLGHCVVDVARDLGVSKNTVVWTKSVTLSQIRRSANG